MIIISNRDVDFNAIEFRKENSCVKSAVSQNGKPETDESKNTINRNGKSEHISNLEDCVRIILTWSEWRDSFASAPKGADIGSPPSFLAAATLVRVAFNYSSLVFKRKMQEWLNAMPAFLSMGYKKDILGCFSYEFEPLPKMKSLLTQG